MDQINMKTKSEFCVQKSVQTIAMMKITQKVVWKIALECPLLLASISITFISGISGYLFTITFNQLI